MKLQWKISALLYAQILVSLLSLAEPATICTRKCNIYEVPNGNCTGCVCKDNYINLHGLGCDGCAQCQKPMVVVQKCSDLKQTDTVCGSCPAGTFYHSKMKKCKNCSTCPGQIVHTPCTIEADSICVPKPVKIQVQITNGTNNTQKQDTIITKYIDKEKDIYFYFFWVVFFMFFLSCVYILWNKWHGPRFLRRTNSTSSLVPKTRTLSDLTHEERSMLVREFPADLHQSLAKLLNPQSPNNWARLAGIWGYTPNEIGNFRMSVTGGQAEFTQELLNDWGRKNSATVEALGKALLHMKREDAFQVLYNVVVKYRDSVDETTSLCTVEEVSEISDFSHSA